MSKKMSKRNLIRNMAILLGVAVSATMGASNIWIYRIIADGKIGFGNYITYINLS